MLKPFLFLILLFLFMTSPVHAEQKTAQVDLDTMIGQMIFVGFKGMDVVDPEMAPFLASVAKGHVGGVILFEPDYLTKKPRNISSVQQVSALVTELQQRSPTPLFVAVDQEGGLVQRFKEKHGVTPIPSAKVMGQGEPANTQTMARRAGQDLRTAGINLNFAPVLDVDINPQSKGLGDKERVFSADPKLVAAHAKAFAKGMQEAGIITLYKHFPGQGSATNDTHMGLSDITATWSPVELEPYIELMQQGLPAIVLTSSMVNRNLDPNYPCSLSSKVVQGLLRDKLGWDGVTMSGDIQMNAISDYFGFDEAILLALKAGQDIPLVPNNMIYDANMAEKVFQHIRHLVDTGKISKLQIEASYTRIIKLKKQAGIQSSTS